MIFTRKKGSTLTEAVILSMFRPLGNMIESGNINIYNRKCFLTLIDNILKSGRVNDATGDMFGVLDKLNRKKYKSNETEEMKAIKIFQSKINSWCRYRITSLIGSIILPIFQALESTMMICDVDGSLILKILYRYLVIFGIIKKICWQIQVTQMI